MRIEWSRTRSALIAGFLAFVPALPAAAQQADAAGSARAAIEAANRRFETAFAGRDAAALSAMYAEDGQLLPPGSTPVTGREAIQAFWGVVFGAGFDKIELRAAEVIASGELLVETGTATLHANGAVAEVANYMVVWRREAGEWRLYRDMWNSQQPEQQ